jgi:hypothetical protein
MRLWVRIIVFGILCLYVEGLHQPLALKAQPTTEFSPAVEQYEISAGDTLWDISDKILGDPFLWPRIWAMNPEITNPHWIYPGDILRFVPYTEPLPSKEDLLAGTPGRAESDVEDEPQEMAANKTDDTFLRIATSPARKVSMQKHFLEFVFTQEPLRQDASVVNAVPDRVMLTAGDHVFLRSEDESAQRLTGQLVSYRSLGEIYHPLTGESVGHLSELTGLVGIQKMEKSGVAKGLVLQSTLELERGQFATSVEGAPLFQLLRVATKLDVRGHIVHSEHNATSLNGTGDYIFVDKGQDDGLERGNALRVFAAQTDSINADDALTHQSVTGVIQIVDAQATSSTCVVIKSRVSIATGSMFETIMIPKIDKRGFLDASKTNQ